MPILMVALLALASFGLIGFLLTAAVLCEPKKTPDPKRSKSAAGSNSKLV
jgi:hypothetical protein